jgi:opacity protein-like surface antigen
MLRKMLLVFAFCGFAALGARAQQEENTAEVFGGYSYLRFNTNPAANLNGWEASVQYRFRDWIGGVADFDGHYGSYTHGPSASTYTYLFGPQICRPGKFSHFGHLLLGGGHASVGGIGSSSFSLALGGGFDYSVKDKISWRVGQVDYLLTQFGGGSQNNFRFSTGIIYRF